MEASTASFAGIGSLWMWIGFLAFVLAMLALDLGVFHRKAEEVSVKHALAWTGVWIALSLVFNAGLYYFFGAERGLEFLTGYLVEKSLSVDNIFVFILIFSTLAIPPAYQHRVLFWGILSALVLRAGMILGGAALLARFNWLVYVFGARSLVAIGIGVVLLDAGVQASHLTNQTVIFGMRPELRSRLNALYMVAYFAGGALGTFAASIAWAHGKWPLVCATGAGFALAGMLPLIRERAPTRAS